MTDLRVKLIEAGAEAVVPFMVHPLETEDAAAAVLDAFLDCLAENRDEWYDKAEAIWQKAPLDDPDNWWDSHYLLAVLREPVDAALGDTEE